MAGLTVRLEEALDLAVEGHALDRGSAFNRRLAGGEQDEGQEQGMGPWSHGAPGRPSPTIPSDADTYYSCRHCDGGTHAGACRGHDSLAARRILPMALVPVEPGGDAMNGSIVYVVDDEESVCRALARLIRSVGLGVETFRSAKAFLEYSAPDRPSCLVLDVRLSGPSGLDLQAMLREAGRALPIVFITGHGDVP